MGKRDPAHPIAMPYELKTEKFSGPLEKLLELIEAEKLDVSEVSMAQVTDSFLAYLRSFTGAEGGDLTALDLDAVRMDLRVLADFISVASKLIFLKSKYLLPGFALTEEEEADIKDLEGRLKVYQELKPALKYIGKLWHESHKSYSRPSFLGSAFLASQKGGAAFFYPGGNVGPATLTDSLGRILDTIRTYEFETETIREKIVTLEEKVSEIMARIQNEGDMQFKNLSGEKSRSEMIIVFLAVLHLAREQIILLEQMENFSDIMVRKNNN